MLKQPRQKYHAFAPVGLRGRTWPDAVLTIVPVWLSTDLCDDNAVGLSAEVSIGRRHFHVEGASSVPIDAFVDGLAAHIGTAGDDGQTLFDVGIDTNIVSASRKAIVSGLSRATGLSIITDDQTAVA